MKIFSLERQQWFPRPMAEVFEFFSQVENLDRITPRWVGFRIHTPLPVTVESGTRLEYTLRLAGVPLRWCTQITVWEPGVRFVDIQERGPYALWEHNHLFRACDGGVLMTDRVRYALPLGPLGRLAHALAVRASLAAIFDYRYQQTRLLLG